MQLNAYTSREFTVVHANAFNKDVGKAVEVIGDMVCNSRFEKNAIEVE